VNTGAVFLVFAITGQIYTPWNHAWRGDGRFGESGLGWFPADSKPEFDVEYWSYYSGHIRKERVMRKMAAAQFKAQCLAVMDHVAQSGQPVVITKHGKPVAKLVPANEGEDEIFGALAGIARITGDIENTVPASEWEVE
jgi:prevent-host-death family protein